MRRKVRIGIDVGGTFTDAVAIDNDTGTIIAKAKTATTHQAKEGVAEGIIQIIKKIMREQQILPEDVVFIAHGTTQATNALLEGDVATVGVIGVGGSFLAKREIGMKNIELATQKFLKIHHEYLPEKAFCQEEIEAMIERLQAKGAEVIVASVAYATDNPEKEQQIVAWCQAKGIYATSGHEVSELYGLKVRTTTAVINASLIPKMMQTANMTEKVIKELGIKSELMIMRADGGVMSIKEVRQRPILTMLSGLAAGVAGALMYGKITEGIFFEIGGTSIDISVIKDGKVMIKNAQVGGHRTYLRSLDVRTLALAGGSMIRMSGKKIIDVGPRSAHLARLPYECFSTITKKGKYVVEFVQPLAEDPKDYVILKDEQGEAYAYTLAGAANILGYIPENDYACGEKGSARFAWEQLAKYCGLSVETLAEKVLDIACKKVWDVVQEMIETYQLQKDFLTLVGGGGSASVLTGALAKKQQLKFKIIENAPYISTIGVAMALLREEIERSIIQPTNDDIRRIRADITEKMVTSGAKQETISVTIEVDNQKNKLIATATGASEFKAKDFQKKQWSDVEITKIVSEAIKVNPAAINKGATIGKYQILQAQKTVASFFGLFKVDVPITAVCDDEGVVVLRKKDSQFLAATRANVQSKTEALIQQLATYSDAGQTIPNIYLVTPNRMYDYSGLSDDEQLKAVMAMDLEFADNHENLGLIGEKR